MFLSRGILFAASTVTMKWLLAFVGMHDVDTHDVDTQVVVL